MIKKIDISELKAGMHVCGVEKKECRDALFFVNNILLRNESDIQRFSNSGYAAVYINTGENSDEPENKGVGASPGNADGDGIGAGKVRVEEREAGASGTAKGSVLIDKDGDFNVELIHARNIKDEAEGLVRSFMNSVRLGRDVEYDGVHETVGNMVGSIFRNQDALLSLVRLKSYDNYTFTHSVNVCVLSLAIGRHMGLDEDELHSLGVGAILHDIGKMLVPDGLLNKMSGLSAAEFEEIKKHTTRGFEIVSKTKHIKEDSRRVVLQHHERHDGTGYQGGLSGYAIHVFARIASVADVYDAMTSDRVYQKAMPPEAALKKMFMMRGKSFETELVERLIRCVGIYPIGTVVELNTGEVAVVKAQNPTHSLQPMVLVVLDKDKKLLDESFAVDLKGELGRWVIASRDSGAYGLDIEGLVSNPAK